MTAKKEMHLTPRAKLSPDQARAIAAGEPGGGEIKTQKIDSEPVNSPATVTGAPAATQVTPDTQEPVKGVTIETAQDLRRFIRKKESLQSMTIRVPMSLYEDLQMIQKFAGRTMTDVIVEGTTPLVAELLGSIGKPQ